MTETQPIQHRLPSQLLRRPLRIAVVGCGGTGGTIACALPYLHQSMLAWGHPGGLDVTLIDGDRVSPTNCVRQPFSVSDIGLHKAVVLANRINLFWSLSWKAVPYFIDETGRLETDILIGCVDSRRARWTMGRSEVNRNCCYMLDIGNNSDSGQVVLGQPLNARNRKHQMRLPTAAELFPELIDPELDEKDNLPSCSALEALERQEPFVNQTLANQALAMLARLFRYGALSHHGCFLNLARGSVTPLPVNPEIWKRMRKAKPKAKRPSTL